MRLFLLEKKVYKAFSLSNWPKSVLRSAYHVTACWDTFYEMPISTPLHAAASLLTTTGCCCWGSPANELDIRASRSESNY